MPLTADDIAAALDIFASTQPTVLDLYSRHDWRSALRKHGEEQARYAATLPGVASAIYDEATRLVTVTLVGTWPEHVALSVTTTSVDVRTL